MKTLLDTISTPVLVVPAMTIAQLYDFGKKRNIDIPQYIQEEAQNGGTWDISYTHGTLRTITFFIPSKQDILIEAIAEFSRKCTYSATLYVPEVLQNQDILLGWKMGGYVFEEYLTKKKQLQREVFFEGDQPRELLRQYQILIDSNFFLRDAINTPPNQKYPELFAQKVQKECAPFYSVEILSGSELEKFGLLSAVGAGSIHSPRVVVCIPKQYHANKPTTVLVGKGVTFDAGGLQIKNDSGMFDMKMDMGGAATVVSTLLAHAQLGQKQEINVIGIIGLVENLLGPAAYKPLDIYRAYNGKTVEIHHTDAEGRLVLADCLAYAEQRFQPQHIISLATLTGACIAALGFNYAGIMGDDEEYIEKLLKNTSPDKYWRLPLDSTMKKKVEGKISDLKNISSDMKAGSSMGGAFLTHFIEKTPYTHIDIAGVAYRDSPQGIYSSGATGFGTLSLSGLLGVGPYQS